MRPSPIQPPAHHYFLPFDQVSAGLHSFSGTSTGGPTRVVSVMYGSPASLAGICAGDVILSINGVPANSIRQAVFPTPPHTSMFALPLHAYCLPSPRTFASASPAFCSQRPRHYSQTQSSGCSAIEWPEASAHQSDTRAWPPLVQQWAQVLTGPRGSGALLQLAARGSGAGSKACAERWAWVLRGPTPASLGVGKVRSLPRQECESNSHNHH